jgi:hypothetical protein
MLRAPSAVGCWLHCTEYTIQWDIPIYPTRISHQYHPAAEQLSSVQFARSSSSCTPARRSAGPAVPQLSRRFTLHSLSAVVW